LAAAMGVEASLPRIRRARLSGTPAERRLERRRVKFSRSAAVTRSGPRANRNPFDGAAGEDFEASEPFSVRFTGRRPSCSICLRASGRPEASSSPRVRTPSVCRAR